MAGLLKGFVPKGAPKALGFCVPFVTWVLSNGSTCGVSTDDAVPNGFQPEAVIEVLEDAPPVPEADAKGLKCDPELVTPVLNTFGVALANGDGVPFVTMKGEAFAVFVSFGG